MPLLYVLCASVLGVYGHGRTSEHNALYFPIRDPFSRNLARQQSNVARGTIFPGFSLGGYNYGI